MPAIRRRARLLVALQELEKLRRDLKGENLERARLIESLIREGLG